MLEARDCIDQHIWWEPKCSHSSVWFDNWTQLGALYYYLPASYSNNFDFDEVNQLMIQGLWNEDLMLQLLSEDVCKHVQNVIGVVEDTEEWDSPRWMCTSSGKFTIESAWKVLRQENDEQEIAKKIWVKGVPFKFSFFLWRLWKKRISIGEVLIKIKVVDEVKCCCCNSSEDETFEHLFVTCFMAKKLWNTFASIDDVQGPVLQLNDTIHKWWGKDCSSKLIPLFKVVPSFITWQIWERRNMISHGGNMSFYGMVMEVNRNLYHLATFSYPWLQNIPNTWHLMVPFFTEYAPLIDCKMVYWRLPRLGSYKCNSDGAVKGVGGPSAGAFCIRNDEGNLIHDESLGLGITSVLMFEAMALRRGLEHYIMHQYLPVILETDSLMLQKILNGIWEIPWSSR